MTNVSPTAVARHAARTPRRTAIIHTRIRSPTKREAVGAIEKAAWEHVTYATLHGHVSALHNFLAQRDCVNARVLLLWPPPTRADTLSVMLALQSAGAPLLYADPLAVGVLRWLRAMVALRPQVVVCAEWVWWLFSFAVWLLNALGVVDAPAEERARVRWIDARRLPLLPSAPPSPTAAAASAGAAGRRRPASSRPTRRRPTTTTTTPIGLSSSR